MRKLTVDDIADHRAYEREREEFRARIIAMKKRRRIAIGDLLSLVFENTDTMRFQVQEMARAERMLTDEQIAYEVETYNELVPDDGELSGTVFLEIDDLARLHEWLPKLTRIQHHVHIDVAGERSTARETDEARLTREDEITSTVHYLKFALTPTQQANFAAGPVHIVVDHPSYQATAELTDEQREEIAGDLVPS